MTAPIFGRFDNAAEPLATYPNYGSRRRASWQRRLLHRARGQRPLLYRGGTPHFRFTVAGRRFVYAYIRKNGCSTFKHFLFDYFKIQQNDVSGIATLQAHFNACAESDFADAEIILVLRPPTKRVCSLFRNKFIQDSYGDEIQANAVQLTGCNLAEMSFADFVADFLTVATDAKTMHAADLHTLPQAGHLWPVLYDRIFLVDNMAEAAHALFGERLGARYFEPRRNSSSNDFFDEPCADWPLQRLRAIYQSENLLPSDESLLRSSIERQIQEIYAVDFELLRRSGLERAMVDAERVPSLSS